ncbi:hypothetical protein [Pseudobacteriovorax antillogorgiicola]|uniref:Uncharacterized protein n=1 Tax=Pseudobacteriovorax antillogorgiicola TaxID=1513793 RepID=A0A1Y6CIU5_9BACT|nr:hypothetical protein [Pseudobacteriovorax antillogorgiicola]TCS48663.1 hypothetical protein EDD56_11785 [Pseudobacteriovorax antillogorgiicola]SMF55069.1 hypothetical protein SAMN06296036_11774 [Pseudobacteriovorax antillogorgiicola]
MKLIDNLLLLSLTTGFIISCGSDPENKGLDDDDATDAFYENEQSGNAASSGSQIWLSISDFFGFPQAEDAESSSIVTALGTAPTLYSENIGSSTPSDNYSSLLTAFGTKMVQSAVNSQCASITGISQSFTGFGSTGSALTNSVRYMSYRLYGTDGVAETTDRYAVLSIPAGATPQPLIMYAHGSTVGLSYSEIAGTFDTLQAGNFIAAPTFPGEKLCSPTVTLSTETCSDSNTVAAATSTQSGADVWDGDVRELMGLWNCLATLKAAADASAGLYTSVAELNASTLATTGGTVNMEALVDTEMASVNVSISTTDVPYTLLIGADRGGLTATLAAARSGYFLYDQSLGDNSTIASYKTQINSTLTISSILPIAVGTLGSNYSLTMGLNRVGLHSAITSNTVFDALPGWALLKAFFSQYQSADSTATTAQIAAEIASRDMTFMEQFMPVSLRNWGATDANETTSDGAGTFITLHPIDDIVVAYSQAQIGDGVRENILTGLEASNSAGTTALPGYNHAVYAFQASDDFYVECANDDGTYSESCASDADGYVYTGGGDSNNDGIVDDLNHVSNSSFLNGQLVSLTESQSAIAAGTTANTAVDAATPCVTAYTTGAGSTVPSTASGALFAPLLARADGESAYSGAYSSTKYSVTPAVIAGSLISYHAGIASGALTGSGCPSFD